MLLSCVVVACLCCSVCSNWSIVIVCVAICYFGFVVVVQSFVVAVNSAIVVVRAAARLVVGY